MDSDTELDLTRDHAPGRQSRWRRAFVGIGIGLYVLALGGLVGTVAERMRFDHRRDAVLAHYDALLSTRNAGLMAVERDIAQRSRPAARGLAPFGALAANPGHDTVGD